jgi:hypothetical protein
MLNDHHKKTLAALLNWMVPSSETHKVPGAGDEKIFKDILATGEAHEQALIGSSTALDAIANESHQTDFLNLPEEECAAVAEAFIKAQPDLVMLLTTLIARCYYLDDRVMRSLDMEPRAPWPGGFEVEQGDWSLLDPVRKRPAFYREAP